MSVQLSEVRFKDIHGNWIEAEVSNPFGDSPSRETVVNLIDNSVASKWVDFNMIANGACQTSTLIFTNLSGRPVSLSLTTANDAPNRDPTDIFCQICDVHNFVNYRCSNTELSLTPPYARFTLYDFIIGDSHTNSIPLSLDMPRN